MLRSVSALLCVACLAGPAHADTALELIPADALGGIAIRNLSELKTKGDTFIKESGLNVPLRPSEAFDQILTFLGTRAGLDLNGSAALVFVNKQIVGADPTLGNLEKFIVVAVPFDDLDRMASNFGIDKGKLTPGRLTPNPKQGNFGTQLYVRGKHLFLGNFEKSILSVVRGRSAADELGADRRKSLGDSDLFIHLGTEVWGDAWKDILRDLDNGRAGLENEAERRTAKEFVQSLGSVRFGLGAVRLGDGLGISVLTVLPKEGAETAWKFLTALRAGDGASSLRGLPEGNVVTATAASGDGTQNALIARVMGQFFLRNVLEMNQLLGASDRPAVLAVFSEIWQRLRGSRFALYRSDDEEKHGLFSLVGILDVEDGARFLTEMKQLARLGSAEGLDLTSEAGKKASEAEIERMLRDLGDRRFAVRESAAARLALAGEPVLPYLEKALKSSDLEVSRRAENVKRDILRAAEARRRELMSGELTRSVKPTFAFLEETELVAGQEVRLVAVGLRKQDAAVGPQLRQLLGPDWNRVRMAVLGRQVVLLVGSDVQRFAEAIRNVKADKPGLSAAKILQQQAKQIDAARKLEVHLSVQTGLALAAAVELKTPPVLSSMALTIEPDRLQVDVWLPLSEIKAAARVAGW